MKEETILLGAFAALEGAHFFSAFLPSVMTIRKFAGDEEAVIALRQGELMASGFALGLGVVISLLIKDPLPMWFSGLTVLLMLAVYEHTISGNLAPNGEGFLSGIKDINNAV